MSSQAERASHHYSDRGSHNKPSKAVEQLPQEEKEHYEPTHIWYSETVFPLTAACFGPLATALNICALADNWRVMVPSGGAQVDQVIIEDPKWLVAVNALSLAIGILASLALLLSMAHRLSFHIAEPIIIVGWYISSILLLVIVSLTPSRIDAPSIYNLAQPFVYACLSSSLYLILATLMAITAYDAYTGHYDPDFTANLTLPQRTLMAQSTGFVFYLLAGAAVFAHIENWLFVDGVYWAAVTLLTIGYGDIVPQTHLGRSLAIPYAIVGIVTLGLVIGSVGSLVLDRASEKMGARMATKEREKLRDEIETLFSSLKKVNNDTQSREKREFETMREIQSRARSKQRWSLLTISILALLILWFIGALIFYQTESSTTSYQSAPWSYFQAVYFCFISLLTIGYGDFSVRSNVGRPLFVFWGLLAVPTMTIIIASMGTTVLVFVKAIIAKIDGFLVLPHETKSNKDSFSRKAMQLSKLKMKAKVDDDTDGREGGLEVHNSGVRNADTGEIVNADIATSDAPQVHENTDAATRERAYLIVKEIRGLLGHVLDSPAKIYTFEEWMRFLKLLGIRCTDEDMKTSNGTAKGEKNGLGDRWSWLRDDGPLFGTRTESEWVLEKLGEKLEELLGP